MSKKELDLKTGLPPRGRLPDRILEGDELGEWVAICYMHSDYLLPGNSSHVLASGYGGLVQGFVPPET